MQTIDILVPFVAPDIILPSQLPTAYGQARRTMAEYQLLVAVLDDAVQCFQKYAQPKSRRQRRLFKDAEAWIMSTQRLPARDTDDATPSFFSFEYVCEMLGIDADDVRDRLQRWRDGQHNRVNQHV